MTEPCIGGTAVVDQRRALQAMLGETGYANVLADVPEAHRTSYEHALATSWVPVDAVNAVIEAAATRAQRPLLDFHRDLVVASTTSTFRTVWRVLLRMTTDGAIVKRAPMIWRKMFNVGAVTARAAPGHGHITMTGWREIPEMHILGFEVGSCTIMELAGRRNVHSRRLRTRDGAVVHLYWDA